MNGFGCLSNVFGLNMVRLAHTNVKAMQLGMSVAEQEAQSTKVGCITIAPAMKMWQFWLGWWFTIVMTALFDGVSFAFAPLEIVAPMSGFSVLINMLVRHASSAPHCARS